MFGQSSCLFFFSAPVCLDCRWILICTLFRPEVSSVGRPKETFAVVVYLIFFFLFCLSVFFLCNLFTVSLVCFVSGLADFILLELEWKQSSATLHPLWFIAFPMRSFPVFGHKIWSSFGSFLVFSYFIAKLACRTLFLSTTTSVFQICSSNSTLIHFGQKWPTFGWHVELVWLAYSHLFVIVFICSLLA